MFSRIKIDRLLASLAALLAACVALQLCRQSERTSSAYNKSLEELIPRQVAGWQGRDEKLGKTEFATESALKTLNLKDYVYRRYDNGRVAFSVYAAHWAAGEMPVRLVASHTPDRCWTENGMQCTEMRFREVYAIRGAPLFPAEYRVFLPPQSAPIFVAYWHIVAGKPYDQGGRFNAIPHPWLWWKDFVTQATHTSGEQFFIRISSETDFKELWNDDSFQEFMTKLATIGLWDRPAKAE